MFWEWSGRYLWSVVDDEGKVHDGWTDGEPEAWSAIVDVLQAGQAGSGPEVGSGLTFDRAFGGC